MIGDIIGILVILATGCVLVAIQKSVRWVLDREYWMGYEDGRGDHALIVERGDRQI